MGFTERPDSVRVDFFQASGKWYETIAVTMEVYSASPEHPKGWSVHYSLALALKKKLTNPDGSLRLNGMLAVCLEPYHELSHPIMMHVTDIDTFIKT